ncbi:MAG: hypothetical protein HY916_12375 [Desulfovibrio sp.]|jgi:hypothetical protein|nr:hypothetical protein [Desulfovibrio sp.]
MTALPRLTAKTMSPLKTLARAGAAALLLGLFALPGQALAVNDDAVLKRMDAVLEENARLRDEAWKSRKNGREAAQKAEEALNASEERVERTRTEALAHVAGVSPAQVEGLRKEGKSWGQAAGELGVHPGFLGVGKTPLYESLPKRKAKSDGAKEKGKAVKKVKKGREAAKEPVVAEKGKKTKAAKKEPKVSAKAEVKPAKKSKKSTKKD